MSEDRYPNVEGSLHSDEGVAVARISARYAASIDDVWSALTEPIPLARWFGEVSGELHAAGEFSASILASGWNGFGRVSTCVPPEALSLTLWEVEGEEHTVSAQLFSAEAHTILELVVRGMPVEVLRVFGARWHSHAEDLSSYLAGHDRATAYEKSNARSQELESLYHAMVIVPLER